MGHTEGYVSVVLCRYPDISKHLKNVFDTGELEKDKTHNKNFQNLQWKVLFPPVILCPANGLNQAVHGLAEGDADAFVVGAELVGPRGQQQQEAGGAVVRAVGGGDGSVSGRSVSTGGCGDLSGYRPAASPVGLHRRA